MTDEADVLARALKDAAAARPEHSGNLERLAENARRMIADWPVSGQVLLHRDFDPDQVLVESDRIVILDLHLAATGEPAVDLGNFLAHLEELGLRVHLDLDAYAACARSFLAGY